MKRVDKKEKIIPKVKNLFEKAQKFSQFETIYEFLDYAFDHLVKIIPESESYTADDLGFDLYIYFNLANFSDPNWLTYIGQTHDIWSRFLSHVHAMVSYLRGSTAKDKFKEKLADSLVYSNGLFNYTHIHLPTPHLSIILALEFFLNFDKSKYQTYRKQTILDVNKI